MNADERFRFHQAQNKTAGHPITKDEVAKTIELASIDKQEVRIKLQWKF